LSSFWQVAPLRPQGDAEGLQCRFGDSGLILRPHDGRLCHGVIPQLPRAVAMHLGPKLVVALGRIRVDLRSSPPARLGQPRHRPGRVPGAAQKTRIVGASSTKSGSYFVEAPAVASLAAYGADRRKPAKVQAQGLSCSLGVTGAWIGSGRTAAACGRVIGLARGFRQGGHGPQKLLLRLRDNPLP